MNDNNDNNDNNDDNNEKKRKKETAKSCPICCETYTIQLRRCVECLYCSHECCRSCVSQYILSIPSMPRCMSCQKNWNREFMYNTMTKTFVIETLKSHTEQLMLEREKALLPATQPIVERINQIDANYNANHIIINKIFDMRREEREALERLRKNRTELIAGGLRLKHIEINMSETLTDSDQSDDERQNIQKHHSKLPLELQKDIYTWKEIYREMKTLENEARSNVDLNNHLVRLNQRRKHALNTYIQGNTPTFEYATSESGSDQENMPDIEKRKNKRKPFVRSCPQEDCRGFLNTRWICGLCETAVCNKCHEIKSKETENEHICDPNSMATAQILMKDTKGCPKCGVQIHKIDGCNVMFCTQCHTPFCWKSGEIIKNERIHNPHYYEWLRQNSRDGNIPREPGDEVENLCDNRISVRAIREKLAVHDLLSHDLEDMVWNVHRINVHIEMIEIPILTNYTYDNIDLRISYLSNRCTEKEWKRELYRRAKRAERNTALQQIFEMINMVVNNEFRKFLALDIIVFQNIIDWISVIENFRVYANQQFLEVSRLYQCRVPKIEPGNWRLTKQNLELKPKRKISKVYKDDAV